MKYILLIPIVFIISYANRKDAITNRIQAISKEMGQVKNFYYKKLDSLEYLRRSTTDSTKQQMIQKELSATDNKRADALLILQKEMDSLEMESLKQ